MQRTIKTSYVNPSLREKFIPKEIVPTCLDANRATKNPLTTMHQKFEKAINYSKTHELSKAQFKCMAHACEDKSVSVVYVKHKQFREG